MLRKILKRRFCTQGTTKANIKKALLLPSKIPIFPFQSHVSVISNEDKNTMRMLGFHNAVSSIQTRYLQNLSEKERRVIEKSSEKVVKLMSIKEKKDK